jgi:hypothetical protein
MGTGGPYPRRARPDPRRSSDHFTTQRGDLGHLTGAATALQPKGGRNGRGRPQRRPTPRAQRHGTTEGNDDHREPATGWQDRRWRQETKLGPEGEKALSAFKKPRPGGGEAQGARERLDKIEQANKSESEKAIDKARKEARKEAETEFEKERRSDRLGVAVAKHARELADVDDVVLNLEQGDLDELFDDEGKVNADALKAVLDKRSSKRKPHLKAAGVGKPAGLRQRRRGRRRRRRSFNDVLRGPAPEHL